MVSQSNAGVVFSRKLYCNIYHGICFISVWLTGREAEFAEKLPDDEFALGIVGVLKLFLKCDDVPIPVEVVR